MLNGIKRLAKKMIYSYRCDEESFKNYLREGGAEIGARVRIMDPVHTIIDTTRPWMIHIGDDVQISSGTTLLTHGYEWSVLKGLYGDVLGSCGEIWIGNNCFIGVNVTVLKGVHIEDNCIIGAGAVVTKNVESGWVAAGNPAKKLMRVEEYRQKRIHAQLEEAAELYRCYVNRIHQKPPVQVFDEFFWLFEERSTVLKRPGIKEKMELLGNYGYSMEKFCESKPQFRGYEEFIRYLARKTGV